MGSKDQDEGEKEKDEVQEEAECLKKVGETWASSEEPHVQARMSPTHNNVCCCTMQTLDLISYLAANELDIKSAVSSVRQVALRLLDCQKVTLFLAFKKTGDLR
jgi:hypothetical protein